MEQQDIESMLKEPARLKWACRRGMLELDLLLTNFVAEGYHQLNEADKRLFIEILFWPDPELFSVLMGSVNSPSAKIETLVQKIRHYARS